MPWYSDQHYQGNRFLNLWWFLAFLDEVSAAYGDLYTHNGIRWMSWKKCLKKSWDFLRILFSLIWVFTAKLKDKGFLCAYHSFTSTCSFQWEREKTSDLYSLMNEFQHIVLIKESSSVCPNLVYFPACEEMCKDVPKYEKTFHKYRPDIKTSTGDLLSTPQGFFSL